MSNIKLKKCTACNHELDLNMFNFKKKSKNIRQSKCKECTKLVSKIHYNDNVDYYVSKAKKSSKILTDRNREYVWKILKDSKCIDCGNDNPLVLDFDHICDKKETISRLIFYAGLNLLKSEISKCEIRCRNCHKIKTYNIDGFPNWKFSGDDYE